MNHQLRLGGKPGHGQTSLRRPWLLLSTHELLLWLLLQFPDVRRACLRRLYDPSTRDLVDEALVLWFPAPRSFTGEVRGRRQ